MNALLMPLRQLVDRKLWPLAILLIAALVAVPMLLASEDASVPAGPTAGVGTVAAAQSPTQPIVSLGAAADRERSRKVLGARKNPFEPAVKAKAAKATSTMTDATSGTLSTGGSPAKGGSSDGASSGTPVVTTPSVPVRVKKTYELFQLKIRFGSTAALDMANRSVKRLTALPRMSDPVLVYLGLKRDLKTAVFLVDANTSVVGDGKCVPHPTNCQNLELKRGETAFVDVLDDAGKSTAQYQLDFVRVLRKTTTDARAARASRRAVARGGRDALRANISRVNGWDYDPETGVLVEPKE